MWQISSARGWRISDSTRRGIVRARRPAMLATSIVSSSGTSAVSAQPDRRLSFSASGIGIRRPTAMSFVK